ncbi:nuclear transport factor 2 family protein [uncultured Maricaulis sp.]|uniref:nuclear transport factor 2 family protein n=1 Tax=uncultured Maricaulis sp. TaxID=174710 RepID=UPI0030DC4DB0|tara:strand:+ start:22721 stop:23167 length:447 start_codon:yes stop_codon:yes gene_type:complete
MNTYKILAASAVVLFSAGIASADEPADISAVLESYSIALADEDVMAAQDWVLAEGDVFTIFEGSGVNIGWADYRDHHLAPEFASEDVSFQVYDWSGYSVEVDHDLAVATFDIRMEYTMRGEERTRDGHGTAVLTRTEAGWRIRHLHTS